MVDPSIRRKTRSDLLSDITGIVRDVAMRDPHTDVPESTKLGAGVMVNKEPPTDGLGLNCIDHVEILCAVEDHFGLSISHEAGNRIATVGQLVDHVCTLAGIEVETEAA